MGQNAEKTVSRKGHLLRNMFLGGVLVIVIAAGAFYYLYLSGGIANAALQAMSNPSNLTALIQQKIGATKELNLGYLGSLRTNVTLPAGDPIVTVPFNVGLLKYYNDTRITVSISGAQDLGIRNFSAVGISMNGGSTAYVCYNIGNAGYTCAKTSSNSLFVTLTDLTKFFNISQISNFKVSQVSPSFYNGTSCWFLSGNGTLVFATSWLNSRSAYARFSTCLSSAYYVPLYLNADLLPQNGSAINVTLRSVNITQATNQAGVTTLPGPLGST